MQDGAGEARLGPGSAGEAAGKIRGLRSLWIVQSGAGACKAGPHPAEEIAHSEDRTTELITGSAG